MKIPDTSIRSIESCDASQGVGLATLASGTWAQESHVIHQGQRSYAIVTNSSLDSTRVLTYILGFPDGSTLALPNVSIGIHHGYPVTFVFSMVPENLAGLFSKNDLTPSELSLHLLAYSRIFA